MTEVPVAAAKTAPKPDRLPGPAILECFSHDTGKKTLRPLPQKRMNHPGGPMGE